MALQVVQLVCDEGLYGVGIVETVSGLPLPIATGTFEDTDDAEAFISWWTLRGREIRRMSVGELQDAARTWVGDRERHRSHMASIERLEAVELQAKIGRVE